MKLASFHAAGRDRVGVATGDGALVDVNDLLAAAGEATTVPDMMALVQAGEPLLARVRAALHALDASTAAGAGAHHTAPARHDPEQVTWHPPVRTPSKVVCLALNNRALDAVKIQAPTDHPAFFLKPFTALTGHRQPIEMRPAFGLTHPEPELGVIVGRRLKFASPTEAMAAVFGYTIVNDVTSVGMRGEDSFTVRIFKPQPDGSVAVAEAHTSYPGRYKASDTFAPMGPWLVTRDEIPDPAALRITCRLGDRLVADDHTRNYVWSVADALLHISRTMTLLPGDIVSMGTAVGGEADPNAPQVPGVTRANLVGLTVPVVIQITGLGTLENPVHTAPAGAP